MRTFFIRLHLQKDGRHFREISPQIPQHDIRRHYFYDIGQRASILLAVNVRFDIGPIGSQCQCWKSG
jgi:hypothetical protein